MSKLYLGKRVVTFGSGAKYPWNMLSNFNSAKFSVHRHQLDEQILKIYPNLADWIGEQGVSFASSEHFWQSLKAMNERTFKQFTIGGRFGCDHFDEQLFVPFFGSIDKARKKHAYWKKKQNVGVIAKMATNRAHANKLGIHGSIRYLANRLEEAKEKAVWKCILKSKFLANPEHMKVLQSTKDDYLLEFDRSARSKAMKNQAVPHWGGFIDKDGRLYGDNMMGLYLMCIRDQL